MPRHKIRSHYVNTGYYPGYDVLDNQNNWDAPTWELVRRRVEEPPPIRFFAAAEAALFARVGDLVLGQDPSRDPWTVPVVNFLDQKLDRNETDGYRFLGMPPMREAFRLAAQRLDETARSQYQKAFVHLATHEQIQLLHQLAARPPQVQWEGLDAGRFWGILIQTLTHIFYSHPYAWNEIGYGGPAYPLGYMRLTQGEPDPWEKREDRRAQRRKAA